MVVCNDEMKWLLGYCVDFCTKGGKMKTSLIILDPFAPLNRLS